MRLWKKRKEIEQKQKVSDVFYGTKNKVLYLRDRVFVIKINIDKIKEIIHTHRILLKYSLLTIFLFLILIFSLNSKANVANFYPTNCLGSWENPKNAEGIPDVKNNKDTNDFSAKNSAILNNANGDLFCGNFSGEIPKDNEPKKFILKFSILATDKLLEDSNAVPTFDEQNKQDINTKETLPATNNSDTTSFLDKVLPNVYAQEVLPPSDSQTGSTEQTIDQAPVESISTVSTDNSSSSDNKGNNTSSTLPSTTKNTDDKTTTPPSNTTTESTTPAVNVLPADTNGTAVIPPDDLKIANDYLKVSYSTDGTDWKLLGMINEDNINDPNFEIPLENIKWEDLSKIQISISPIISIDKNKIFYLDGMWIESEYDKIEDAKALPKISLDDPSLKVISGNADFSNNEDIVFNVSDPVLSKDDIVQLINEDKAKVLEDKDKVLESSLGIENINPTPPGTEMPPSIELPLVPIDGNLLKNTKDIINNTASETVSVLPDTNLPLTSPESVKENSDVTSFLFGRKVFADTTSHVVEAKVLDALGNDTKFETTIENAVVNEKEIEKVHITKPTREFKPGKYSLHITLQTDTAMIETEQDFTWGVLVVNTNKSIYDSNDDVYLQMGVLNGEGHTLCTADLKMDITTPSGISNHFSTSDNTILKNKDCGPDNVIDTPDYYAHFLNTEELGDYKIKLTATTANGIRVINDGFQVDSNALFEVERITSSRIQPIATYPVSLKITAQEDFSGTIIEHVPASFNISQSEKGIAYDSVSEINNDPSNSSRQEQIISWNLDMKKGETKILGYKYDAPDISPEIFLLGPLEFFSDKSVVDPTGKLPDFKEIRQWQIASDGNNCTATISGTWSTAGNWQGCGGLAPQAGDNVTINGGVTITMDIDVVSQIGSVIINNNGVLDMSTHRLEATTINVVGTLIQGVSSLLELWGTSGTLFTLTGTYTPSASSNVSLNSDADVTLTSGVITFSNLNIGSTITANRTYTFGAGNLTINSLLQINPTASGGSFGLTVKMGGDIFVSTAGTISIFRGNTTTTAKLVTHPNSTDFNITTGLLNLGQGAILDCSNSSSIITLTGIGTNTLFAFNTSTYTLGTSKVLVTSASGSPKLLSNAVTFYDLTIATTGATVINATAAITVSHNLYVQYGVLNDGGKTIVGNATGTLKVDGGAGLCIGGTPAATNATCNSGATATAASTFPSNFTSGNITLAPTSNVYYNANLGIAISTVPTYGNLYLMPTLTTLARNYSMSGTTNMIINGDFTINPSCSGSYLLNLYMGFDIIVASGHTTTITRTSNATSAIATRYTGSDHNFSTGFLNIATGGTLNAASSASNITLSGTSGTLLTLGGTFTVGSSTVILSGNGDAIINSGSPTFYNLTSSGTGVKTLGAGITMASNGTLSVTAGTFDPSTYAITANGTNTLSVGASGTIRAGKTNFSDTYPAGFTTKTLTAGSTVDYYLNGAQNVDNNLSYSNLAVSTGGTKTLAGDTTVANIMTINSGATLDGSSRNLTLSGITGTPFVNSGVFTPNTGTVTYTGNCVSSCNTNVVATTYNNLTLNNSSETYVLTGTTTTNGNLTITAGTLDVVNGQNYALNVGGNWSNSGTFTAQNGLVALNTGTTASVGGGPTTFYNLTITHSAAKEVDFSNTSANIIHVTHIFTVSGHTGNLIKLYSDSTPNKWHFHPTGTAVVDYADVKDGGCELGAITITPTHSTNSNNNDSCWSFGSPASITFSMSGNNADFGVLTSSQSHYATAGSGSGGSTSEVEGNNFTITDSSAGGYSVSVIGTSLTDAISGHIINTIGISNTAPSPGSEQFGIRLTKSGGSGVVSSPYDGSGFAYVASGSTASQVCSAPTGDGVPTIYSVRYLSNISPTTNAGIYHTTLTYLVTGNF